jgi:Cd2+/Zn2+-exporting ATPase
MTVMNIRIIFTARFSFNHASIDEEQYSRSIMAGKDEEEFFLSLEDEKQTPDAKKSKVKIPKLVKNKTKVVDEELEKQILDAEVLDDLVVEQPNGIFEVEWPLIGMDCPDCAGKAFNALDHLMQTTEVKISATTGEVSLKVDLEHGLLSQVSSVLKSLGHPPDVSFYQLSGVNARVVAKRNKIEVKEVEKLLLRQPGVLDVEVNRDNEILVQLLPAPNKKMLDLRDKSLERITGTKPVFSEVSSTRLRPDQWRLFGGALAVPLLILILIGELLAIPPIVIGLIGSLGVLIGGLQMFHEAIASLMSRQMGFQVLTSIAVIGASVLGMWEEALMVVILVAVASHLESSALEKARDAMQGGLDRIPRTARRMLSKTKKIKEAIKPNTFTLQMAPSTISSSESLLYNQHCEVSDEHEVISLDLLEIGDIIEVRSGELIPADGKITDGFGALDKAPLTGESAPVEVELGDEIQAGLILARGPVLVEVTAVGDDTRLSGLIEAVHSFKEQKPEIQNLLEKFTAIWVPIVLFGALAVWYFMFPSSDWKIILLLWVVACPCALLLAAAMPHAAALSRASRMGAIVRGGDILERLSKVNHILLDKTGTLTSGKPTIGDVTIAKGRQKKATLGLAGGLEKRSSHPYAHAILEYLKDQDIPVSQVTGITDVEAGVKGLVSGKEVYFIRADIADKYKISIGEEISNAITKAKKQGYGMSLLARDDTALALFTFIHDDTRSGSKELIHGFNKRSVSIEILSGDQQSSVSSFAAQIGLPDQSAHGGLSPEQKVAWVEKRSQTHVTMMVGDGFNDSAALAVADVGIAVGTGESVNMEAADIMFPGDEPKMLLELHDLSRKMNNALIVNIALSVIITFTLVFAVVNGWYDELWVGVLIHEASVLLVILNGARLAGKQGMMSMLGSIMKTLWSDTVAVFLQFKQHYFTQPAAQKSPEIDLHATS